VTRTVGAVSRSAADGQSIASSAAGTSPSAFASDRADPPACAWCGAGTRPVGPRLVRCEGCGVAVTFPVPDPAELDAAYAGFYRPESGRFSGGGDWLLRRTRGTLARRIDAVAPAGPVLDVGAGDGALLDALGARGRVAVGLERGSRGRDDVVAADLTDFADRRGEWAAVVMWHSLEHLRDAPAAIDHAAELLAPGGVLILAVPNYASWQARMFGPRWLALDLPRHLSHLTPAALARRVSADGLTMETVSFWRGGQVLFGWLHGLVASLPGRPDLYDAIRLPEARAVAITGPRRAVTLGVGVALAPLAAGLSAVEVLARAGGSVFLQARKR
jgi:SAM-dependent methyltransferase